MGNQFIFKAVFSRYYSFEILLFSQLNNECGEEIVEKFPSDFSIFMPLGFMRLCSLQTGNLLVQNWTFT